MAGASPELLEEMLVWRLVIKRIATLQEIETHYSLDDLLRANAVLDMSDEIERATIEGLKHE